MSQNLFWRPFLNRIFFFYFKNVNVFMFFNFEPRFIEKFFWESGFSKFWSSDFFRKTKIHFFGSHFEMKHYLIILFSVIKLWLFWVYTHMVQVLYRNSYGKVLKDEWVQVAPLPCAQTGAKSSLVT